MSITNLLPDDCPIELRVKIERVMAVEKLSWSDALIFLASKVVSPKTAR